MSLSSNFISDVPDIIKAALPASGGAALTGIGGTLLAAPGWLVGISQAAIVVIFTVRAIDKKLSRLHEAVNEARGEVETLRGRLNALQCQGGLPPCDE